jgi:acetolactate synthase-1/2/3 large subunit
MAAVSNTVARTIIEHLAAADVQRLYGLPGGEMLELLEAARQAEIDFILVHHEASAAFMAAAEGRYRRSPGACISTIGPGATNLVTGVAHAYLDRCPVIVLTPDLSTILGQDYTHQRLDLSGLFRPITKGAFSVEAPSAIDTVENAIAIASTEPFGPVSIHLPRDVASQIAGTTRMEKSLPNINSDGLMSLEAIADRLNKAQNPLVVIGLGTSPNIAGAVRDFVEAYGAPAGVTPKVKGMLNADHPLYSGTYGGMMAESVLMEVIGECDVILGIGLEPTELDRDWPKKERVIWMLPSPNVSQTRLPDNTWCGDLQSGLKQLCDLVNGRRDKGYDHARKIRTSVRNHLEKGIPSDLVGMSPLRTLDELAILWPVSDLVCCDVGAHKLLIGQQWPASIPNRFFLSNGLSSMGYGIAAPIALSVSNDYAPVLSVIGDGGLMMYLGELETAVRTGAHVLYVVLIDNSLALIESAQRRRNYPLHGMRFNMPDITQIGALFGMPVSQIQDWSDLRNAVDRFHNLSGPALIGINIDAREYDAQAG